MSAKDRSGHDVGVTRPITKNRSLPQIQSIAATVARIMMSFQKIGTYPHQARGRLFPDHALTTAGALDHTACGGPFVISA
jgi:hypothetical protein